MAARAKKSSRRTRRDRNGGAEVSRLRGARRADFPEFIEPCLATLRSRAPDEPGWLHEIKLDGYRAQAHIAQSQAKIYTRRGHDWSDRFGSIAQTLARLRAQAVLDGEVVVLDSRGVADYYRLQADLARKRLDRLVYFAFDLLYLDGFDLRAVPLIERKRLLGRVLDAADGKHVRCSEHIETEGGAVLQHACAMRLEGVVSKQRDSPYRSGRQDLWIKTKCKKGDNYPIVAFVEKLGARPRRVASLYVGRREGDRLLYAGKVRSGYTELTARELRERLDPYIRKRSPLSVEIRKPKATWVEPTLQAEVEYSGITSDGILREAVFKGLRDDLAPEPPRANTKEPVRRSRGRGGVPKENILQLLPDAVVPTKEELRAYWNEVAPRALEFLGQRPLKLVRHTRGTTFYHMGPLPPVPPGVHTLQVEKRSGGRGTRLWVEDLQGLLGLVDIGVVEIHPWNATVDDVEHPDMLVFDLDPGSGVPWEWVVEAAIGFRHVLKEQGYWSWPKLTGGKGVHVVAPTARKFTHDAAHRYCKAVAQELAAADPSRYTLSATAKRAGRLFIDYLRNGRGTTAVGAYSPRARSGIPIAAPTTWREIERGIRPDAFDIHSPPTRRMPRRA